MSHLLTPGNELTLRPMKYPLFYEMYLNSIKNTWTVDELDFSTDITDLASKVTPAERHMIQRLVAFFATGDTIVSNNLALGLYRAINSPEARMYLSRQLMEEALHIQFYLTVLDTYIPDPNDRAAAFKAVETIPSIKLKADFCTKHTAALEHGADTYLGGDNHFNEVRYNKALVRNLIAYACCIEGLFFFGAFAYVFYLRNKGMFQGLASGTNMTLRDECLAEGTEVLTPKGWVAVEALSKKDKVAQFDMQTSEVSFVKPSRYIVNEVDEDLMQFSHQKGGIHQLITKNHDMVYRWDHQPFHRKVKAGEWRPAQNKLIPTSGFKLQGEKSKLTSLERLLIAIQADGSISDRYDGSRSGHIPVRIGLKRPRKIKRLLKILGKVESKYGVTWTEQNPGVSKKESGYRVFVVNMPLNLVKPTKLLSDWVDLENVTSSWASSFLEELGNWDGHRPKDKKNGNFIYYSSAESSNVDIVQAIASLCGRHASRSVQIKKKSKKENYRPIHRTWISDSATVRGGPSLKQVEVPYRGRVYCVTVPTGAIVIRSQGKVSVTGNCMHMNFGMAVLATAKKEQPELFDAELERDVRAMMDEALACEMQFADDVLHGGITGLSRADMQTYLQYLVDVRLTQLGYAPTYNVENPFAFIALSEMQTLTNFFERRVTEYQKGLDGDMTFEEDF